MDWVSGKPLLSSLLKKETAVSGARTSKTAVDKSVVAKLSGRLPKSPAKKPIARRVPKKKQEDESLLGPTGYQREEWKNLVLGEEFTPDSKRTTVLISPAVAADWLKVNLNNRAVSSSMVSFLVKEIRAGRWLYDGNPIRFDWDGNLIDGQHRLMAIAEGGFTVESDVIAGMDPRVKEVVDTGRQRSTGDVLTMKGFSYGKMFGAALRLLHDWEMFGLNSRRARISNQEIIDLANDNPDLMESVKFVGHRFVGMAPGSALAVCHFLFAKFDSLEARRFIDDLQYGSGLSVDDPVYLLREKLLRNKSYKVKGTDRVIEVMSLSIKAWNYRRKNESVKSLFWRNTGVNAEPFPRPI
jgi:hypothetical protein